MNDCASAGGVAGIFGALFLFSAVGPKREKVLPCHRCRFGMTNTAVRQTFADPTVGERVSHSVVALSGRATAAYQRAYFFPSLRQSGERAVVRRELARRKRPRSSRKRKSDISPRYLLYCHLIPISVLPHIAVASHFYGPHVLLYASSSETRDWCFSSGAFLNFCFFVTRTPVVLSFTSGQTRIFCGGSRMGAQIPNQLKTPMLGFLQGCSCNHVHGALDGKAIDRICLHCGVFACDSIS